MVTRFIWRPDCQEHHDVHDPEPQIPDDEEQELYCEACGHDLDMVYVHVFEIGNDEPHTYDRAADSSAYADDANPDDLCYVCGRPPQDELHVKRWRCSAEQAEHWPVSLSPDAECGYCGASGSTR